MSYKSIIKKNLNSFFSWGIICAFVVFIVFSYNQIQYAKSLDYNFLEFIIHLFIDQYYVTYFLLPLFLILIFRTIGIDNILIKLRLKKYMRYYFSQMLSFVMISTLLALALFCISIILGLGLPLQNSWSKEVYSSDLMHHFSQIFNRPSDALLWGYCFFVLGLSLISNVILFLNEISSKANTVISVLIIYFMFVAGMVSDLDKFSPFIFLNNYLLINSALNVLNKTYYIMIPINILLMCCMYSYVAFKARGKTKGKQFVLIKYFFKKYISLKVILAMISLITLMAVANIVRYTGITSAENVILIFKGHGIGYFKMFDFLWMLVYNGFIAYIISLILNKEFEDQSSIVILRLKKKKQWLHSMITSVILLFSFYIIISFVVPSILELTIGFSKSGLDYKPLSIIFYGQIFIVKLLELLIWFYLIWIVSLITNSVSVGFITVICFNFVCTISVAYIEYFPLGMSSLYRWHSALGDNQLPFSTVLITLSGFNIIFYYLLKKVRSLREKREG